MRRTQRTCGMGMAFILAAGVWCSPRLAWGGQAPVVTSVSPSSAPSLGGTVVTISGANFVSGATVDFGGVAGTGVIVNSSTAITVTTPLHPPGTVTVTVTVNGQSGQLSNAFAFSPSQAPAISGIAPATGSTNGGIKVTITGSGFVSPASVNFGTAAAAAVTVVSATQLTALAPSNSAGAVDVRVINPDTQSAVLSNAFTYVAPPSGTASFRFLTTSMPEASTN
ncbi:MAG: IPT/TIG domain-containing protein, partial [Planctomycetota bacterium]